MIRARKAYPAPETWAEMHQLRHKMMVDLLKKAQEGSADAGFAAKKLGISRNNYVLTCRRLGVEIEHLLDQEHPRWKERIQKNKAA